MGWHRPVRQGPMAAGGEHMGGIEKLVRKLPPELQQEVVDFAQSLLQRQAEIRMGWRAKGLPRPVHGARTPAESA